MTIPKAVGSASGGRIAKDSVEAFAVLQARLSDPFADRLSVLSEMGLDEARLRLVEDQWTERFAANDRSAESLAAAFAESYMATRQPAEAAPELSPPKPDFPPPKPEQKALYVPSFLKEQPPPPRSPSFATAADPPEIAQVSPLAAAPPNPTFSSPVPAFSSPVQDLKGTAEVDVGALMKKSVPFDPFAKSSVASGDKPPVPNTAFASRAFAGETAEVDIAAIARGKASADGRLAATETAEVDIAAIARGALAFAPKPSPPVDSPAAAPTSLPAPSPNVPAPTIMTLDKYALLSAEIAMVGPDPTARASVFKHYGIAQPDSVMAEWRSKFSADPGLAGRWSAAYAEHYARLRQDRGPRQS